MHTIIPHLLKDHRSTTARDEEQPERADAVRRNEPLAQFGRGATESLVQATRAALLQRERLITAGEYFVHDIRHSRDVAVPIALAQLAAAGLTPALKHDGLLELPKLQAMIQLYRALTAEQRRDLPRLAARVDTASERPPAPPQAPPPRPARPARPHWSATPPALIAAADRRLAAAVAVSTRRCPPATDFSPSGSWQSLPTPGWYRTTVSSLMASGAAAMIVTTMLVRAAWTLLS
jgi:hypothetical protein